MADNELKIDLTGNAETRIDGLIQKLRQATAEASNLVSALDKGAASPADVRGAISTAAGAQSALSGLASSATSTPSGGQTSASQSAATSISQLAASAPKGSIAAAAASFPAAIQAQIMAQLGASGSAPAATQNVNHVAAQVALSQSAMTAVGQAASGAMMGVSASALYGGPGAWTGMAAQSAAQQQSGIGSFTPYQLAQIQAIQNLNNVPVGMANTQRQIMARTQTSPEHRVANQALALSLGYMGVQAISGGFDYSSAAMRSGGSYASMPSEGMGFGGTIGGGMVGLGIGAIAGAMTGIPALALLGAMGGSAIGGSVMRYLGAPYENANSAIAAMSPFRSSVSGMNRGYVATGEIYRLQEIGKTANANLPAGLQFDGRAVSPEMGRAYGSIYEGLFTGGIDPFRSANNGRVYSPGTEELDRAREMAQRSRGAIGAAAGMALTGIGATKFLSGAGVEQVGESYLRRLATIYGNPNVAKMAESVAPVFASLPTTGGNVADMLGAFGPTITGRYLRIQNDDLTSSVPSGDLMHASAVLRGQERRAAFAGLQARGTGAALQGVYQTTMETLATLPGGRESLAYAQATAGSRQSELLAFQQSQTSQFDTPMAALHGQLAIARVMPYAPGQVFGLQAQGIRLTMARANRTQAFLNHRRQTGQLSEDEELSLTQQIASDRASSAGSIAAIAEGAGNILPGIAAGGRFGSAFHRFNSVQQASLFLGAYGSPRRSYGAMGGRQAHAQQDFYDSFGVPTGPYSRSAGANGGMGGGNSDNLLVQILRELQQLNGRGAGSFPRMDRNPRDISPGGYGTGGKFN